jgi:hypothetical protein
VGEVSPPFFSDKKLTGIQRYVALFNTSYS